MLSLGPFDLERPVSKGGMGVVWRGLHREQGIPVALKVLTAEHALRPEYVHYFRNEVRAVAALDHPGIVTVFDYGEVGAAAAALSGGSLAEGCPYLVMEWASGGTLADRPRIAGWRELCGVLTRLLDALAHAHARGVVHRDLKPANVLVCSSGDLRPGIKIADFGIAHQHEPDLLIAGTASFMAPEQAAGDWRDQGPWTDLYSLGCLAFMLIEGRPPFRLRTRKEVLALSRSSALPPITSSIALPPGFDRWLTRLLHPAPDLRYVRAADAAWALQELDRAARELGLEPERSAAEQHALELAVDSLPTLSFDRFAEAPRTAPSSLDPPTAELETRPVEGGASELALGGAPRSVCPAPRPPPPASWRRPEALLRPVRLLGAGLGLYGARSIPLVDRERERDALWDALLDADRRGRAELVVLSGAAGHGKSRLAEWICERAHEAGIATVLKALHGPTAGPSLGLGPMVARHLRAIELSRESARERVSRLLTALGMHDPDDWEALVELALPPSDADTTLSRVVRPRNPAERHALLTRFVAAVATERPVVIWLDDVQWALDAVQWSRHVLEHAGVPALLVLTVREDGLADRPRVMRELELLASQDRVRSVAVGPLDDNQTHALVRELLGIEGQLAARVARKVAGNPLFALQMVGDWVQRGLLELGQTGFRLRRGVRLQIPDDLHAFWSAYLDRLLEGRKTADAIALEIAAALGPEARHDEWTAACRFAGAEPAPDLVEMLIERRAARAGAAGAAIGWAFSHGMLRESLERRAREASRWRNHHRACAAMIEHGSPVDFLRLGQHLLEAAAYADALQPLLAAARQFLLEGDFSTAESALENRRAALDACGAEKTDPRRAEGWVIAAELRRRQAEYDDGERWAALAEDAARSAGQDALLARALNERGRLSIARGAFPLALACFTEADGLARTMDDTAALADAHRGMARCMIDSGHQEYSISLYQSSYDHALKLGDDVGAGTSCLGLQEVEKQRGDNPAAIRWLERAREHFERCGSRWGTAAVENALGDVHRLSGSLDAAARHYREAYRRYDAIGAGEALFPQLNVGLALLTQRRYEAARPYLERGLGTLARRGRRAFTGAVHVTLLVCEAAARNWTAFDEHLASAHELLAETGFKDVDTAACATRAAELAQSAGDPRRAREAYLLALAQWEGVHQPERADDVRARLSALAD